MESLGQGRLVGASGGAVYAQTSGSSSITSIAMPGGQDPGRTEVDQRPKRPFPSMPKLYESTLWISMILLIFTPFSRIRRISFI